MFAALGLPSLRGVEPLPLPLLAWLALGALPLFSQQERASHATGTAEIADQITMLVNPIRLRQLDEPAFLQVLPAILWLMHAGREAGASPESVLRHALRLHQYSPQESNLTSDAVLRAFSRCDQAGVFRDETGRNALLQGRVPVRAGPSTGSWLEVDFIVPPMFEPAHARRLGNLEMRLPDEAPRAALDPRRRIWNDRLWEALGGRPAQAATSTPPPPPSVPSLRDGIPTPIALQPSGQFTRINVRLNETYNLTPFGAPRMGFVLFGASTSRVRFGIADYSRPVVVTRFDSNGLPYTQTVPTTRNIEAEKVEGVPYGPNLTKSYLIYDLPGRLRIHFLDALDYSDNERPILIEPYQPIQ